MKIAVVGSRNLKVKNLEKYLPKETDEIISGGAKGIDTCAREYALLNGIKLTEFLPDYNKFGKKAPLERNLQIIDYADEIIAFWDKKSTGTRFVIANCRKRGKKIKVYSK